MNISGDPDPTSNATRLFVLFGFAAPIVTFLIALSGFTAETKITLLAAVALAYTGLYFAARAAWRVKARSAAESARGAAHGGNANDPVSDPYKALDEASQFFGASLKPSDMFRLVASRVKDIIPFEEAILFRPNDTNDALLLCDVFCGSVQELPKGPIVFESCLAGIAFLSGEIEVTNESAFNDASLGMVVANGIKSAAALPLVHEGRVMAVFQIYTIGEIASDKPTSDTLEALRTRITPLLLGSFAADRSIANAFTDSVTELPNERAFFMVLENQLAESIRFRDERPLTVLSIDLKNFRIMNEEYGHSTGDLILSIAASRIQGQLRKMDFLARFEDDEFVIVLPLVDEKAVYEVIARLRTAFSESSFQVGELEIPIDLNFGSASFWRDGETPQQLVQHAQLRKQQAKAETPGNVAWFQKEYVN